MSDLNHVDGEQECSNCICFKPDETGDGCCNNARQIYDYVAPDEWCIHHELKVAS